MASDRGTDTDSPSPGGACSYAELVTAEALAERFAETDRDVTWRSVWVPADPALQTAVVALAATALGLVALRWPVVAGLALTAVLAIWSIEIGGIANPLSPFRPKRATQDVLADDPRGSTGAGSVLLLVRADLPKRRPRAVSVIASRIGELTWLVIALTLVAAAGRALGWDADALGIVQLLPALLALGLLSIALAGRWAPLDSPGENWTGVDQALEAIAVLERDETTVRRSNLAIVGASDAGGTTRILRMDRGATAACKCWEFGSGAAVLEALSQPRHSGRPDRAERISAADGGDSNIGADRSQPGPDADGS